jgi:hypothetical protein
VCGFWTDTHGNNHGFFGFLGQKFVTFDVTIKGVTVTSTSPFGCNDEGEIVGSFTDGNGNMHRFIFVGKNFFQFDATGSSQIPAFGVMGLSSTGSMIEAISSGSFPMVPK